MFMPKVPLINKMTHSGTCLTIIVMVRIQVVYVVLSIFLVSFIQSCIQLLKIKTTAKQYKFARECSDVNRLLNMC